MQQIIFITLSDSIYEISDHYILTLPCVIPAVAEQGETIINKTNECSKMPVRTGKSCTPAGEFSIKSRALRDFVSFCCSAETNLPCGTIRHINTDTKVGCYELLLPQFAFILPIFHTCNLKSWKNSDFLPWNLSVFHLF